MEIIELPTENREFFRTRSNIISEQYELVSSGSDDACGSFSEFPKIWI